MGDVMGCGRTGAPGEGGLRVEGARAPLGAGGRHRVGGDAEGHGEGGAGGAERVGGERGDGLLLIGQMARLNSVSEKALRVYQAKGILEPVLTDEETGYRYYSLEQCATLDMVSQLQSLGFSLDQIAEIASRHDVSHLRACVSQRLELLESRSAQLAMARQVAGDLLHSCDVYLGKPVCGEPRLEALPARQILRFELDRGASDPRRDGRASMADWERDLRGVRRRIVERGWPLALFRDVGCIITRESLASRDIVYSSAFVSVSPAFGEEVYAHAETVGAGVYLTEYIDSLYTPDGSERETVELLRLLDECAARGLEPAGDYLGEVIADGPAFQFRGRQMLFRMCLPVQVSPTLAAPSA